MFPNELLSPEQQARYNAIVADVSTRQPFDVAEQVAWEVLKSEFDKADSIVASPIVDEIINHPIPTPNFDVFSTEFSPAAHGAVAGELVCHAEGDEFVFEGVLTDTMTLKNGKRWTTTALQNMADQINKFGISGDISSDEVHKEFGMLTMRFGELPRDAFVRAVRSQRSGIVKAVKAVFADGKLWVKGYIDKRYMNHVPANPKMSIEALVPKENQVGDEMTDGIALGLTIVDDRAICPRSFVRTAEA